MRDLQTSWRDGSPEDEAFQDPERRLEAAQYLRDMAAEMAALARRHRLGTMAYLLDMAQLEAVSVLSGP